MEPLDDYLYGDTNYLVEYSAVSAKDYVEHLMMNDFKSHHHHLYSPTTETRLIESLVSRYLKTVFKTKDYHFSVTTDRHYYGRALIGIEHKVNLTVGKTISEGENIFFNDDIVDDDIEKIFKLLKVEDESKLIWEFKDSCL